MKKVDFTKERQIRVYSDQGQFDFNSFEDMLGNFSDISNSETWAKAHENVVFVCHRFDIDGKIIESFETEQEAADYAIQLNEFFAICEEYNVEEL